MEQSADSFRALWKCCRNTQNLILNAVTHLKNFASKKPVLAGKNHLSKYSMRKNKGRLGHIKKMGFLFTISTEGRRFGEGI